MSCCLRRHRESVGDCHDRGCNPNKSLCSHCRCVIVLVVSIVMVNAERLFWSFMYIDLLFLRSTLFILQQDQPSLYLSTHSPTTSYYSRIIHDRRYIYIILYFSRVWTILAFTNVIINESPILHNILRTPSV